MSACVSVSDVSPPTDTENIYRHRHGQHYTDTDTDKIHKHTDTQTQILSNIDTGRHTDTDAENFTDIRHSTDRQDKIHR